MTHPLHVRGLPLSGSCKLALVLLVAALVPARLSLAQTAPPRVEIADSPADMIGPAAACPPATCDDETQPAEPDWTCIRPFRSLLARLKADCGPIPWANWSAYPLSVGCFGGIVNGGPLIEDWVGTTTGFDGGWRLGWDVDPSWGTEMRMAFGSPKLYDSYRADQALTVLDNSNGLPPNDPQRARFDHRFASLFQWDVDILYYPWAETRLRPYLLTGMGLTNIAFTDRLDAGYQNTCLSLPLGVGVKYLCTQRLCVRLDLLDDIALRTDHLQTQQNLSLTFGVELRFGGSRKVYWPWDTGREFW